MTLGGARPWEFTADDWARIKAAGAAAIAKVSEWPEPGEIVDLIHPEQAKVSRSQWGRPCITVVRINDVTVTATMPGGATIHAPHGSYRRGQAIGRASSAAQEAVREAIRAERAGLLVIVPCGGAKLDHPAPAGELYTGSYHRACRQAAERLGARRVLILSALHGLLELDEMVEPYDLRMGQPGCVDAERVGKQARELGELYAPNVTLLLPSAYAAVAAAVWPDAARPLVGADGMGYQLARLAAL